MHQTLKMHRVLQITTKQKLITSQSGYGGLVTVHPTHTNTNSVLTQLQQRVQMHLVDLLHQLLFISKWCYGSDLSQVKYGGYVDHFGDAETVDVSFLIVGSTRTSNGDVLADHNSIVNQLIQIAENRKDCMVIASPEEPQLLMLHLNQHKVQMLLQTTRQ